MNTEAAIDRDSPTSLIPQSPGLLVAPLLAGVLLVATYFVWHSVEQARADRRLQAFGVAVERVVSNLSDRISAYELILRGVKGYYEGSDAIDHNEFHTYVQALNLPQIRPGLQSIALLASVPQASLAQHEAQMRRLGRPDYRVTQTHDRQEHALLTHIEAYSSSHSPDQIAELGQDAFANPYRRQALEHARDTGLMALSGPLEGSGRAGDSALLAMFTPIYALGSAHDSVAGRRLDIEGWVGALFRIEDVIRGLARELDADLALAIHDGPSVAGSAGLFASRADYAPEAVNGGLEAVRSMDVGGRRWTLVLYPLPAFEERFEGYTHHLVALLGVAFSLMAGWFVGLQITARRRAMALAHDMTHALRHTRDELESTLNAVPDLLVEVDANGRVHHYRSSRANRAGTAASSLVGRLVHDVLPAPAAAQCMAALAEAGQHGYSEGRQYGMQVQGVQHWFELSVARKDGSRDAPDAPQRFIALARDVTRRHEAEAAMQRMAYFDALTGLSNRRLLLQNMHAALQQARQGGWLGGLFYIDLDNFKQINDARGHGVGDSLLVQAASRLNAAVQTGETMARMGGDEFVMLVPQLGGEIAAARQQALLRAERLRESLEAPYEVDGARYSSTGSIGVTLFPKAGEGAEDLLREADTAMFRAKDQGRNQVCFFEQEMHTQVQDRLALEQDLKGAVAADALLTYAQPQVDTQGRVTGAELLLRWNHPQRGWVPPTQFIAVAEESGLIARIGARVIRQACATLARLHQEGRALTVSVNVSSNQFRQADFVDQVRQALADTGAPPGQLMLEVTESLLIENWQDTARRMHDLVALGVRLSIDDFGTGYSSLAYLKRLPLYELKIDRSFVQDAPTDANDAAIVKAILSVARHLRLHVVAEGVETREQAEFLTAHQCDGLQGYLFGRPQPLQDWLDSLG